MPQLKQLLQAIQSAANPAKAEISQRFFKTKPGQYGHGDIFHGITVPDQRLIAKKFPDLSLIDLEKLLISKFHEERLIALIILGIQFDRALKQKDAALQEKIANFYLSHSTKINNWDLVDASAAKILGTFLLTRPRKILYQLVKSTDLWERRISIIATHAFIKAQDFQDTLKLSEQLLQDPEDLIHKAVGWMLREVGKQNRLILDQFLQKNYQQMPRTALRYAIEHHPEAIRQKYLKGQI